MSYVIRIPFVCQSYVLVCHTYVICMSLVLRTCHSYITRVCSYFIYMYSYAIRMAVVCTGISSVCHSYVLVCNGMPLVYTRMSFVRHSHLLVCHPNVTCI